MYVPFRVRFDLSAPIILHHSIALDGLLAWATYSRTEDHRSAHLDLPLAREKGLYLASEVFLEGPVMAQPRPYVLMPRWESIEFKRLVDTRGKPRKKMTGRDQYKIVKEHYTAYTARRAHAFGRGDIAAVRDLLSGLKTLGKKGRAAGLGKISRMLVTEVTAAPEQLGIVDFEGNPARAVPLEIWKTFSNTVPQVQTATGCGVEEVLDAAHVGRHWGYDNEAADGILLRADIHRLRDAGLLAIGPDYRVSVKVPGYETYDGKRLRLPKRRCDWPKVKP